MVIIIRFSDIYIITVADKCGLILLNVFSGSIINIIPSIHCRYTVDNVTLLWLNIYKNKQR